MAKELKISLTSGRVQIPNLPGSDASAEEKDKRSLALMEEVEAEIAELDERIGAEPRDVLKQVWVLTTVMEAHPKNWIKDFSKRRARNALVDKLKNLKTAAIDALPEGEGKMVWENLPYVRTTLELLFDKQRTSDAVKRLILSPLGKLQFTEIKYARDSNEDLARVCQELSEVVRNTANLDEEVRHWGHQNRRALLRGQPPEVIPPGKIDSLKPGLIALAMAAVIGGVGGAMASGAIGGAPNSAGIGVAAAALLPLGFFLLKLSKVGSQKRQVPREFAELSARFKERLYLICCLRTLYKLSSRLTVTDEAYREHVNAKGGKTRWKEVKFEQRDLTELFANESWDPRGTVEHWLAEKVKLGFRLDSTHLISPEDLDDESWDILLKAYLLESMESHESTDAKLLEVVSDLLFTKRGEDIATEKNRVFSQIRKAWEEAERREGQAL